MNRIGACIALGSVVLAGCQGSSTSSFAPQTKNAERGAAAGTGDSSGLYEAWVPHYDLDRGPARVSIQIGPAASGCHSSVVILPMKQGNTAFKSRIYHAPVTVSKYAVRRGRAYVVASADLGSDLGTWHIEGLAQSKSLAILYRDRHGGGAVTAGYVRPCTSLTLRTRPAISTQAFIGTWHVTLDNSTFGLPFQLKDATLKITYAQCAPDCAYVVFLRGQVIEADGGSLPLMKTPLPYCVNATWAADGYWGMEVESKTKADGICGSSPGSGFINWGTYHWFPPGRDASGAWAASHDFDDAAPATGGLFGIGP